MPHWLLTTLWGGHYIQPETQLASEVQSGMAKTTCGHALADKPFLNPEAIHYSPTALNLCEQTSAFTVNASTYLFSSQLSVTGWTFPLVSWTTVIGWIKPLASPSSFSGHGLSQPLFNRYCSSSCSYSRHTKLDTVYSAIVLHSMVDIPSTSTLQFKLSPPGQIRCWSPVHQWLSPHIGVVYCDRILMHLMEWFIPVPLCSSQ